MKDVRRKEEKKGAKNARQTGVICPGSFAGFATRPSRYKKGDSEREETGIPYALLYARWQVPPHKVASSRSRGNKL